MFGWIMYSKGILPIKRFVTQVAGIHKLSWEMYGLYMIFYFWRFLRLEILTKGAMVALLLRTVPSVLIQIFRVQIDSWNTRVDFFLLWTWLLWTPKAFLPLNVFSQRSQEYTNIPGKWIASRWFFTLAGLFEIYSQSPHWKSLVLGTDFTYCSKAWIFGGWPEKKQTFY